MNIGLLIPRSAAYPEIGLDFIEAIKLYLRKQDVFEKVNLLTENIGYGGAEKEVFEKAEKLLTIDEADVLIAYLDLKILPILEPLISASGKLMIVINPGANYPQNWAPKKNIIYLTLQHAFLCQLTGKLAAERAGSNEGLMATSFYDCGYLHGAAMVNNFTKHGGKIMFNYINNQAYDAAFDINKLSAFIEENRTVNKLLCIYDAMPASMVYKLLNESDAASELKLFVSPMMLETKALETINNGFNFSIEGYIPWHHSLKNKANVEFIETMKKEKQKTPSAFSLLGWETGILINKIINDCNDDLREGGKMVETILATTYDSPRGNLKIDPLTHFCITPVYQCLLEKGTTQLQIHELKDISIAWEEFIKEPLEGVVTGWTNTYLCY